MLFPAVHTRSILFGFVLALAVAAALVAAPAAKGKETTLVAQAGERTGPVRHGAPPQRFHPKARRRFQRRIEKLVREIGEPGIPMDDGTSAGVPPIAPPRVTAWQKLKRTTEFMEAFLREHPRRGHPVRPVGAGRDTRHPAAFRALARRSLFQAKRGLRDLVQVSTDFPGAMDHLDRAGSHMVRAQDRAPGAAEADFSEEALVELTDVTARLAVDGIERARSAGVDRRQVAEAEAALEAGRRWSPRGATRGDRFSQGRHARGPDPRLRYEPLRAKHPERVHR